MSSTFTTTKSDYLQPAFSSTSSSSSSSSSTTSYDASQSPLALLAQTCSSIGKDCPSPPAVSTPPIITSLVSKTSSSSNQEKAAFLSTKRSVASSHVNRKSTLPLKPSPVGKSSPLIESNLSSSHFPSLFDPTATALFLRSSLAYLAAQQQQQHSYSSACPIPGCLQCETVRHILAASTVNHPSYPCHGRYSASEELLEQARALTSPPLPNHRFHPYLKPTATTTTTTTRSSTMINNNDQLPFFYPHLSLSPLTGSTRRMNNNPNNTN